MEACNEFSVFWSNWFQFLVQYDIYVSYNASHYVSCQDKLLVKIHLYVLYILHISIVCVCVRTRVHIHVCVMHLK